MPGRLWERKLDSDVTRLVRDRGEVNVMELEELFDADPIVVSASIARLERAGVIEHFDDGALRAWRLC